MLEKIAHLKISHKLGLVVLVMAVPMLAMVMMFLRTVNVQANASSNELAGLEYLGPVLNLYSHAAAHRDAATAVLSGDVSQKGRLATLTPAIESDLAAIGALDQRYGKQLGVSETLDEVRRQWAETRERATLRESNEAHAALAGATRELIRKVADKSSLILDPDLDAYYLMSTLVIESPSLVDDLSQMRTTGAAIGVRGRATAEDQAQALAAAASVRKNIAALRRNLQTSVAATSGLGQALNPAFTAAVNAAEGYLKRFPENYARPSVGDALDSGTAAIDGIVRYQQTVSGSLKSLLDARVAGFRKQQFTQLMIGLAALLGVGLLARLITRGITRQVESISTLFLNIGMGDFQARAEVVSPDELGVMAESLNSMLDNTLSLIQSQEERDRLQASIQKLLDEISVVADGDLRVEAEVTEEVTGAIADSFNQMIQQLRSIIAAVQATTLTVGSSADEVQATTVSLAQGSEEQASQIVEVSAAIDEMAVSIQQVSENAMEASKVADTALQNSKRGSESVNKTIEGMNGIRQQVQQTAKRIKRLGESSQEIDEIVRLIGDIADRTSILALNASIQAAMAGEAGKGFAVVAEEVERLADRSTEATKKIATLIKSIQTDTNEAIAAMEETTREVVTGSALANEAGQRLDEIEGVSGQLAQLIQSISLAAKQQSRGSETVAVSVSEIANVTQQTAAGAKQAAASINHLSELADELRGSLDRFRLPAAV